MITRADLHRAITDALDTGRTIPCVGDTRWLSDRSSDIHHATLACRDCPVLAQCRTYSEDAEENAGVWAGKRRGRTQLGTLSTRGLTPQQKVDIDDLIADGATTETISRELGVTLNQVNYYRTTSRKSTA